LCITTTAIRNEAIAQLIVMNVVRSLRRTPLLPLYCCIPRRHILQVDRCCCIKLTTYLFGCFAFVWQYFRNESVRREILLFENGQRSSVQLQPSDCRSLRMQPEKFRLSSLGDRHRLPGLLTVRAGLGLTTMPVVPWEGPPAAREPPINCQIFTTLC